MAEIPGFLLRHKITVEPLLGDGPYGEQYGPPVEVPCWLDSKRRLVRNADGDEVVSETTAYCRMDRELLFPTDSRVTLPGPAETKVYVISTQRHDDAGLGAWQHLEVTM